MCYPRCWYINASSRLVGMFLPSLILVHPLRFFHFCSPKLRTSMALDQSSTWIGLKHRGGRFITQHTFFFSYGLFCWTKRVVLIIYPIQQHKKRDVSKPAVGISHKVILAVCQIGLWWSPRVRHKFFCHPFVGNLNKNMYNFLWPP